ncbi:MAG: UDP-3-O-(3-hydroxymyristoyl)glucosamine N-acyltransferase [Achromobacter sp.]
MPVLLDPGQAPALAALLEATDTQGLTWHIEASASQESVRIAGVGTLAHAGEHELAFLTNPKYQQQLASTRAAAVIVTPETAAALTAGGEPAFARVVCQHAYLLYARIAQWFDTARQPLAQAGIHPTAIVDSSASIDATASIGPYCVIGERVRVAAGVVIGAGSVIAADAVIGAHTRFHPRVTVYTGVTIGERVLVHSGVVLGADGFGLAPDPTLGRGAWRKIPQLGSVSIGDDVEIGANTTIDRGALENTEIGAGVKLDNQIMVAHNVRIGAHTAVAACVGIAGSTVIGERCTIGGAAMLSGHLTLGDDVHISGGTAVTSNIAQPGRYTGVYPYAEHSVWQKNAAVIQQLGHLRRRIRALEQK